MKRGLKNVVRGEDATVTAEIMEKRVKQLRREQEERYRIPSKALDSCTAAGFRRWSRHSCRPTIPWSNELPTARIAGRPRFCWITRRS